MMMAFSFKVLIFLNDLAKFHKITPFNMKKIILILLIKIFFFTLTPNSFAWDSTAAKFYPMAIGNSYTFIKQELYSQACMPTWILGVQKVKITRDTVLSNGKKYFVFEGWQGISSPIDWKYQRIDSTTMNVYFFDMNSNQDRLIDSLRIQVGDTFKCNRFTTTQWAWAKLQFANPVTAFGQTRVSRSYPARASFPTQLLNYQLLEGIGFSSVSMCELGGVTHYLKGCVISGVVYGDTTLTNIQQIGINVPDIYKLRQNYPNPFNPSTNIKYDLIKNGNVKISVYDVSGKEVASLVDQFQNAGSYQMAFNATGLSSGVYFYKLETDDFKDVKRMVILK